MSQNKQPGTLRTYQIGFASSVILTLAAFYLVSRHVLAGWGLVLAILALAVIQLCIQLIFFLHLGDESRPRWRLNVFLFMLMVLLIVVVGSLWIMYNLNYRMMPDTEHINQYLHSQEDT